MIDADTLAARNEYFKNNRIVAFYHKKHPDYPEFRYPNPLQEKLLEAWKNPRYKVFTYSGGNRIGKCVTYGTLIDTPNGEITVGKLFENQKPFDVYAWDGEKKVVAKATPPFKKDGLHECYRIKMSDGRVIEAADFHRILTTSGWRSVHHLYTSWHTRQESNSGIYPSIQSGDDRSFVGRSLDYRGGYFEGCHQYGGLLPREEGNGLISVPSQDGDRLQDVSLSHWDGRVSKYTSIYQLNDDLPSTLDALRRNVGQFFGSLIQGVYNTLLRYFRQFQASPQLCVAGVDQPQPFYEFGQSLPEMYGCSDSKICSPYVPPVYCDVNSIISINPIGVKSVYDFEVKKYHNYCAGGLVHHNTFCGGLIAVSTMLGEWPWSGEKMDFPHKRPRKVRYVGQAWESHIKAVVEPMVKFWWPTSRGVETRKNNQGIESQWTDLVSKSTLEIMSNVQDSSVFEGWEGDLVIYDEPPKRDVRVACARGLIDRQGRELFCMTLLKEAWIHREVVKARLSNGEPDLSVFNINGDIYSNVGYGLTEEGVAQFEKTLTADEKQARLYGKPSYMTSLVFPKFSRDIHVRDEFAVPLDWIVDISIDFHPSKKWAIVFMATARNGIKYICDEIHEHGNPKYIAEQIVRRVKQKNYRTGRCIIDPLSKGDKNNDDTVYDRVSQTLGAYNISLETASKDKDNGIALVNNLLWTENEMPGIYYFKSCPMSIQQTEDLMYDPDSLKPTAMKVEDDFTECIYRLALLNTQWFPETTSQGNKINMVL